MSSKEIYQSKTEGYFAFHRPEMLDFIPITSRRILEVGCGTGVFGAALKSRQPCQVTGVELMPDAAAEAGKLLDEIFVGNVESFRPQPGQNFDCIVFNDVLEHLVDPWGVVIHLSTYLVPGGVMVASIPNMRHFKVLKALVQDGTWNYTHKGVMDKTHLRFFTKRTIPGLFEPAGLTVTRIEGISGSKRFPFKYALINWLSFGSFEDARHIQFGCVAQKPDLTRSDD